jgi:hypothetical protein
MLRAWLRERDKRSDARSSYLFLSERRPMTGGPLVVFARRSVIQTACSAAFSGGVYAVLELRD